MGYGITPLTVRLTEVQRAFGSQDATLVAEIIKEFKGRFDEDDCDVDDEDEPTLGEALQEIIGGKPLRKRYGHKYGYVLEMLCSHFGEHLPNANFSAMDSDWADEVDRGLVLAGVPQETIGMVRHVMYRGSPLAIPEPDDFPAIGYLRSAEVGPALRAIEAAELAALDPEVRDAVTELRGWLESCARSANDLVCFYY